MMRNKIEDVEIRAVTFYLGAKEELNLNLFI